MLSFAVFVFVKPGLASKNLSLQPKTETNIDPRRSIFNGDRKRV
jgi:hypothetical protein